MYFWTLYKNTTYECLLQQCISGRLNEMLPFLWMKRKLILLCIFVAQSFLNGEWNVLCWKSWCSRWSSGRAGIHFEATVRDAWRVREIHQNTLAFIQVNWYLTCHHHGILMISVDYFTHFLCAPYKLDAHGLELLSEALHSYKVWVILGFVTVLIIRTALRNDCGFVSLVKK